MQFTDIRRPRLLSTEQLQRQGKFFNLVGLNLYQSQQPRESQRYFLLALEYDPKLRAALTNYVEACFEREQYQAVLDAMDLRRSLWQDRPELDVSYALALSRTNRPQEAMKEYEKVFRNGTRNDDHFTVYVQLLADAGQREAARAAIDRYLAGGDSLSVTLAKARCLSEMGKHEQAIDLLKARLATSPGNVRIVNALIVALDKGNRLPEGLDAAKQLLANGNNSTDTLVMKGMMELRLKWYKEAKSSFEAALRKGLRTNEFKIT